jgi:hypothetical protein
MKKLIAFLISTVIPVVLPICAIVTLPVCVAEKYLPPDLRTSIQYGVQFFHLVWAANGDSKQQPVVEKELTPYVESTVTSMTLASLEPEPDCEFAHREESGPALLEVRSVPTPVDQLAAKIDFIVEKAVTDRGISRMGLQKLQDLKFNFKQEMLDAALQNAMHQVEVVNHIKQFQKRNQKALRVVVKTKPISPA